ncbi:Tyrosine-protein kinase YwqD [Rubripirellula amarantea]|uniref:Tyrosine-protein kinase YwqD n=1 Tax=Rubripirellula amarantea TaxID=2527999 RepID=A0A5C5WUQ3_9BACT|nr:tyrosine-protein kinase domain-containing protein [Rubripirellula amarantea]TWT54684.1 Tyrosine-protein kinase YwqD [Rubripirellula amarantea]
MNTNYISSERATETSYRPSARPENQFDPWILWVTFRQCWPWAVPCGAILSAITAFVVLQNFTPTYRASHLLEANDDFVVFKGVMPTVDDLANTEKSLFFNPIVIDPVLADPEIRRAPSLADPDTAEVNLRKNLTVGNGGTRARLVVSYEDSDREAAAMVCNAVVDSYLRQRDAFDNARMTNLEMWLEPEIQRWEQQVEERQLKVTRLSEQTLGFAPGQRLDVIEDQSSLSLMTHLRSQIADLSVQLAIDDAQIAMQDDSEPLPSLVASTPFVPPAISIQKQVPTESQIAQFVANDAEVREAEMVYRKYQGMVLEMEISDLVRVRRDYYLEIKAKRDSLEYSLEAKKSKAEKLAIAVLTKRAEEDYQRQMAEAEAKLTAMKQLHEVELDAARSHDSLKRNHQDNMNTALKKRDRAALVAKLGILQKQYDEERDRMEQFGGATAALQFAQEELSVATDVLRKLRDRTAAIQTERRQDGAVRTLASATPPKNPTETIPVKQLGLASTVAFVAPFLLGLLLELRIQRVTDGNAVQKHFGMAPVVGEIARLPAGTHGGRARRVFEESVDTLRSNLFHSLATKNIRSIAVASSMTSEGKSSVASQLAISIAKATGETVLLVDADLRCPDQHSLFGLDIGPGLAGVLSGEVEFEQAIDSTLGHLIHVMPAGPLKANPHRLINQASMKKFLDQALESYSFVVFDTAPVLAAGETLAVVSVVESTLVCVMRDVSRLDNVGRAMRRIQASGASIAGTVFSGVTPRQYSYRYGDYHYSAAGLAVQE